MMNAAVYYSPDKLEVTSIPFVVGEEDVAIKVKACAVCGYDARIYRHGHKKVRSPIVLGHEICGEVMRDAKTLDGVIRAGTRVAVSPLVPCLSCQFCRSKMYNLCKNLREIGSSVDGGFAEYLKVQEQTVKIGGLVPVPDNLNDDEAALLEPLACCLNGFSRLGSVESGQSVVIVGDGPIGLIHLQLCKMLYNARTAVVGKIPLRAKKAKQLGADAVFIFDDDTESDILDFTEGGASVIIVATSNPEALNFITKISAKNARINLFAGFSGSNAVLLDPNWIHYNQVSVTGSFSSTPQMLAKAASIASDRIIDLSKIVTHQYPLREIKDAIKTTESFQGLRSVIDSF